MTKIAKTKKWIEEIVIGLDICPFAKDVFDEEKISYYLSTEDSLIEIFQQCLEDLNENKKETSFIIFEDNIEYEDLLDLNHSLELALEDAQLEDLFQIVPFHPDFKFEGSAKDDRVNFVNRSPIPMIHILKTSSIGNLNLSENAGEEISNKNERMLAQMSKEEFTNKFIKR